MEAGISLALHTELYASALFWGGLAGAACGFLLGLTSSIIVHWSR